NFNATAPGTLRIAYGCGNVSRRSRQLRRKSGRNAGERGQLARHARVREEVGPVREHVHVVANVAHRHRLEKRRARSRLDAQLENPFMVLTKSELARGT